MLRAVLDPVVWWELEDPCAAVAECDCKEMRGWDTDV